MVVLLMFYKAGLGYISEGESHLTLSIECFYSYTALYTTNIQYVTNIQMVAYSLY